MEQKELEKILESHKRWLEGEDGKRANLRGVDLHGADLHGADLRKADLYFANLSGADLYGADLYFANLHGADLHRANLLFANLSGADLYGADLHRANLLFANFTCVKGLSVLSVQVDTSRENRQINYIPSLDIVTAGYFQGTLENLEKKVEEKHKDNPFVLSRYRRVIAFLKLEAKEEEKKNEF